MIVEDINQRVTIEEVVKYFSIPLDRENKNLYLRKDLYFKNNKSFLNNLYYNQQKKKKYDKKIDKDIIDIYKYKIFEII